MDNGSMDSGSHGHEGSAASSSNLSALAPPFTVVPKPIASPLGDWTESSYGVPLSFSPPNWLPTDYPDSGLGLYSNHTTEYDPMPSSDAYGYGVPHDIHSPYTHSSPVNPIASVSVDGMATSTVEAQPYYPSYIPLPIEDHDPMVVPDDTSYDLSSSSHVVTLDGSSKNDHTQSGCHLEGGFCSKELTVSGSSSVFMNDANLGAQASKGSYTCEEGSNIIDMLGWEKHSGCSNMEWPSNKSFPVNNLRTMPIDYSKTSTIGAPSLLLENPPKKPSFEEVTKTYERQVPCIASYEKHIRHCNASMSGSASCVTSSPSLVIGPPDVDTSMSAPNTGAPSLLLEKPHKKYSFEEITQMYEHQVPCIASHEKHIRHCNASMSGSASCVTSSPSLVIRPPDVNTSMSAPNTGAPSLLLEKPHKKYSFEEITQIYERQVPCIASHEKHIRHCNASMSGSASCVTSSPSLVIRPPDVNTSMSAPNTGAPSLLLEKPHKKYSFEEITQIYERQVPCIASHEKHIRHCNASMSGSASCVTSSPSLVIRPPDVDTSMSAPNTGPLEDMNFGTDVTDPNVCGNSPSYTNESFPLLGSKNKVRFDTSQLRMHLDTNDSISMESLSLKNEELSKKKEISEDALDQVFKPKSGFQISCTRSDGFNLTLDPIENSSESLDYYNPVVDSPCWKGAPVICFPPFEASKAIGSQYMRKIESCNSSDSQVPKVFPLAIDDAVKFSSQNPNEKTMYVGRGLAPAPKGPSNANSLFRDPRSDGSVNANDGSFLSKSCYDYTVQHTDSICEPWEDHALPSMSTVGLDLTLSLTRQQNFESSKMIPEKHSSETCVEVPGSSISDATSSPDVSFYSSGYGLSSSSSLEDSSAKLTELHEPDSTPKIDVQMLINIMRNMSDLLLFHSSNDSLELKDGDCEVLKDVIFNLHRCILKDGEQMTATRESIFPQQGTSQYLEDLPKLPKEVNVDRPRVTKEAAVITRDQLDHKGLLEEKHHNIGSGNKMEMISDFVSVKGGANMVEKDNMTQAIMKVLSENCDHEEEEMQPNGFLYKYLWLEAEAELCSINYKARYNRMRIEMEKSELHEAKVNTLDVEKRLRSKAYCDLNAVDKLKPKAKVGPYSGISIQDIPSMQHVMARYGILKHRIDHSSSATTLEEASSSKVYPELNKVDQLTPETAQAKCPAHDMSIQTSPIISPTCHPNDVMARFNILKGQGGCINPIKATNVEEPPTSSVSPLLNEVKKDTLIPDISIQNSPISTRSPNTDDVEDSIMTRFHILKCRDDNSRSMDVKRQEPTEVVHLGFSDEKNHRPVSSERSEDGGVDVKLGPVLQHRTANSPEDKLTVKEFHLREDDPTVQSRHSNRLGDPLAAGWYDSTSSDWEHVTEEELMGSTC